MIACWRSDPMGPAPRATIWSGIAWGFQVIAELVEEDLEVLVVGTTGVTFFTATVAGTFGGEPMSARLRYTRAWVHADETGW